MPRLLPCLFAALLASACSRAPKPLWERGLGGSHHGPPALGSAAVFVSDGGAVQALDLRTGATLWSRPAPSARDLVALEHGGIAFNADGARILDAAGRELWAGPEKLLGGGPKALLFSGASEALLRDAGGMELARVALEKGRALNRGAVEEGRFYLALRLEEPKDKGGEFFQPGLLQAYDFSGRLLWEAGQRMASYKDPQPGKGLLYSAAAEARRGELAAYDKEGGRNAWAANFQAGAVENRKRQKELPAALRAEERLLLSPAAEEAGVTALSLSTADGDKFLGLDASNGRELFQIKATYWGVWEAGPPALTQPRAWGGRFYAGAGRYLACFNPQGKLLWRHKNPAPLTSPPALGAGLAACLDAKNHITLFEISTD